MHVCAYHNSLTDLMQDSMTVGHCQVHPTENRGTINSDDPLHGPNFVLISFCFLGLIYVVELDCTN